MNSYTNSLSPVLRAGALGVFSLFAGSFASAVEPQPDNAKPPVELENEAAKPEAINAKIPFIGVVTASLPEMVADHLNIKAGTGLIVRTVMPESPAEKSGLKVNDIILNINDTAVNDPETFSEKIRTFKIGDKLKLKAIQRGKPADIEVTLGERPKDEIAGIFNQAPLIEGLPEAQAKRLRDMIERNLGAFGEDGIDPLVIPDNPIGEKIERMRKEMGQIFEIAPGEGMNFQLQGQSTITMMDDEGSVEIKSKGENKEVIVRDKANTITWSGPWDTEQDKAAAPDDIRKRIERMNIMGGKGIQLRLGGMIEK